MKFTIRSRDDRLSFSLTWESRNYWAAVLSGPGATAQRRVVAFAPFGDFRILFAEMAHDWRGWEGTKRWASLEGELKFSCASDGLGHVTIEIDLETEPVAPSNWRTTGGIVVEAGQLDALAKSAAAFLDEGPPA